jgi:hypothetical protein
MIRPVSRFGPLFLALAVILFLPGVASSQEPDTARNCSAYAYAPPFQPVPANYVPRYNTVAQRFLDDERNVGPVTPSEYGILDELLDEAKSRLKPIPVGLDDAAYDKFAVESLQIVNCILVRHGFVYPGIGLVQLLSDGLDPTMFNDKNYYAALLANHHNEGRTAFIEQRKPGPYYVVDCDVASYLYLALGEIMKYPVSMMQCRCITSYAGPGRTVVTSTLKRWTENRRTTIITPFYGASRDPFRIRNLTRQVEKLQAELTVQLRSEFRVLAMPEAPNLKTERFFISIFPNFFGTYFEMGIVLGIDR